MGSDAKNFLLDIVIKHFFAARIFSLAHFFSVTKNCCKKRNLAARKKDVLSLHQELLLISEIISAGTQSWFTQLCPSLFSHADFRLSWKCLPAFFPVDARKLADF